MTNSLIAEKVPEDDIKSVRQKTDGISKTENILNK